MRYRSPVPFPERLDPHGLLRGRVAQLNGCVEVFLAGELDLGSSDGLHERLAELAGESSGDLVLDLQEVVFLGSAGLATLLAAHQEIAQAGRRLVLRNVHGTARHVLEVTGLVDRLNVD